MNSESIQQQTIPCDFCFICSKEKCMIKPNTVVSPTFPCEYCETCTKSSNITCKNKKNIPPPSPVPVPVPEPVPVPVPVIPPSTSIASWFTQELWDKIFPYAVCSMVYSQKDNIPFYTRDAFITSIDWLNIHANKVLHGFGESSSDLKINKLEVAAFLAGAQQETGDGSLVAPYPWGYPKAVPKGLVEEGPAGGLVCVVEGLLPQIVVHDSDKKPPLSGQLMSTTKAVTLSPTVKGLLGLTDKDSISTIIQTYTSANQPQFGLGPGTGNGVVFQDGLAGVSSDGTLYGNGSLSKTDTLTNTSKLISKVGDPVYTCSDTFCQYSGRGLQMLSYNYNYSPCSIDLFGDYRLVKYPNLLITADIDTWNGLPQVFGFPGPNANGKNKLPEDIIKTTPSARQMAWISSIWFWMTLRSGRSISCHEAMMNPSKYGITSANLIVNNQTGLENGSWASKKIIYYKRICKIFGFSDNEINASIVVPPKF